MFYESLLYDKIYLKINYVRGLYGKRNNINRVTKRS